MKNNIRTIAGKIIATALSAAIALSALPLSSLAATVTAKASGDGETAISFFAGGEEKTPVAIEGMDYCTKVDKFAVKNFTVTDGVTYKMYFGKDIGDVEFPNGDFCLSSDVLNDAAIVYDANTLTVDLSVAAKEKYYDADNGTIKDGEYTLEIFAVEGESEESVFGSIFCIDTTAPTFTVDGTQKDETTWIVNAGSANTRDVKLSGVSDEGSGVGYANVSCDGEDVTLDEDEDESGLLYKFTARKNGTYDVTVTDKVGNEAKASVIVENIDKTNANVKAENTEVFLRGFKNGDPDSDKIEAEVRVYVPKGSDAVTDIALTSSLYGDNIAPKAGGELNEKRYSERTLYSKSFLISSKYSDEDELIKYNDLKITVKSGTDYENTFDLSDATVAVKNYIEKVSQSSVFTDDISKKIMPKIEAGVESVPECGYFKDGTVTYSAKITKSDTNDNVRVVKYLLDGEPINIEGGEASTDDPRFESYSESVNGNVISSTISFNVSEEFGEGDHTIKIIAEKVNSNNKTEYLNIASDTFRVDTKAPRIGSFSYKTVDGEDFDPNDWTKKNVTVNFTVTEDENDSGIVSVKYYLTSALKEGVDIKTIAKDAEGTYPNYSFTADTYGKYMIIAADNAGNEEKLETAALQIDTEAPTIKDVTYKVGEDELNANKKATDWTQSNVTVSFTVDENHGEQSLKDVRYYRTAELTDGVNVDDIAKPVEGTYSDKYHFTAMEYGSYVIIAADKAGNEKTLKTVTVRTDKKDPVFGEWTYGSNANEVWTNKSVTLKFTVKERAVKSVVYYPEGQESSAKEATRVGDPVGTGDDTQYTYSFTAENYGKYTVVITDMSGRTIKETSGTVLIDKADPEITAVSYSNNDNNNWTPNDVTINFELVENTTESGIKPGSVKYSLKGSSESKPVGKKGSLYSFTVSEYGEYEITASDIAGNNKTFTVGPVLIDKGGKKHNISVMLTAKNENTVWNFLTFGLFTDNTAAVTVSVENTNQGSAPITSIVVTDRDSEKNGKIDNTGDVTQNGSVFTKTVTVSAPDKDGPYDLIATITDAAGNTYKKSLLIKDGSYVGSEQLVISSSDESSIKDIEKYFEVVISANGLITVSDIEVTSSNPEFNQSDKWYSNEITFAANVEAPISGIAVSDSGVPAVSVYFGKLPDGYSLTESDLAAITGSNSIPDITKDAELIGVDNSFSSTKKEPSCGVNATIDASEYKEDGDYILVIKAADNLNKVVYKAATVKIDCNGPEISSVQYSNSGNSVWTNEPVKITFNVADKSTGIKKVLVDGVSTNVKDEGSGKYSFEADSNKKYNICAIDNVSNESTVETQLIKFDNKAPAAEDCTVRITANPAQTNGEGLYTNSTIKVKISAAKIKDTAPIKSITLLNRGSVVASESPDAKNQSAEFTLPALENEDDYYDLSFKVEDKAGNASTFNIANGDVKVYLNGSNEALVKDNSELYKIVSTLVPPSAELEPVKTASPTYGENYYGSGTYSFKAYVSDDLSGISKDDEFKVYFGPEKDLVDTKNGTVKTQSLSKYDITDKLTIASSRESEQNAVYSISGFDTSSYSDGRYAFVAAMKNKAGNTGYDVKTILLDKTAPVVKNGVINYNGKKYDKDKWYNENVEVTFTPSDTYSGVKSVQVFAPSGQEVAVRTSQDDKSTFTASEYGVYTIRLTDNLGNSAEVKTDNINIDKGDNSKRYIALKIINSENDLHTYDSDSNAYNNKSVAAQIEVYNLSDLAPIKEITLTDSRNGSSIAETDGKVVHTESGKSNYTDVYSKKYTISEADSAFDLVVKAVDEAGNTYYAYIPEPESGKKSTVEWSVFVSDEEVEKTLKEMENFHKLIVTTQTPEIDIDVKETQKGTFYKENGVCYVNKKASFNISVVDKLSGIADVSDITAYFGKSSELLDGSGMVKESALEGKAVTYTVESADNMKNIKLSYSKFSGEDGEYVLVVKAKNKSGNTGAQFMKFMIDNTAPGEPVFTYISDGKTYEGNKAYEGCGWSSDKVTVSITPSDNSSGIASVKVGSNTLTAENGVYSFSAPRAKDNSGKFTYTFKITDNLGNTEEYTTENIKQDQTAPVIDKITNENDWGNGDQEFTVNVREDLSGIDVDTFEIQRRVGGDKYEKYADADIKPNKGDGTYPAEQEYNVTIKDYGYYRVAVKNSAGLQKTAPIGEVKIDKTAPKITNVRMEKTTDSADKFLNFITFGIYSNDNIKITVEAEDEGPCKGTSPTVILTKGDKITINGTRVKGTDSENTLGNGKPVTVEYEFVLPVNEEGIDYTNLYIQVKDSSNNTSEVKSIREIINEYGDNMPEYPDGGEFEIVVKEISATTIGEPNYADNNNSMHNGWYSGDVTVSFDVENRLTKIQDITVELNGKDVTDKCVLTEGGTETNLKTRNGTSAEKPFEGGKITLDTSKAENGIIAGDKNKDGGKNKITITVTDNTGAKRILERTFKVDNTKPEVTGIDVRKPAGTDKLVSFLTFGIFANNSVDVEVTIDDKNASAGINKVTLIVTETAVNTKDKNKKEVQTITLKPKKVKTVDGKSVAVFTLPQEAFADTDYTYSISAKVLDNVNHESDEFFFTKDSDRGTKVTITGEKPVISDPVDYLKDNKTYYDSRNNCYWFNDDISFTCDIIDTHSGIHSVKVELNDTDVTECCNFEPAAPNDNKKYGKNDDKKAFGVYTNDPSELYSKRKTDLTDLPTNSIKLTLDTKELKTQNKEEFKNLVKLDGDGKNTIKVTAVSNNGLKSEETMVYYRDNFRPTVTGVSFERVEDEADKALNFLFFGLLEKMGGVYSNSDIKVTVTAVDEKASSGLESIRLYNGNTEIKDVIEELEEIKVSGKEYRVYTKSFMLKVGKDDKDSFYNDLRAVVKDNVGYMNPEADGQTVNSVVGITNDKKITTDGANNKFEVAASTSKPKNGEFTFEKGKNDVIAETLNNGEQWFSGDVKISVGATDTISKLHQIGAALNGFDAVSAKDTEHKTLTYTYPNDKSAKDKFVDNASLVFNTKDEDGAHLYDGANEVSLTAAANNGNSTTTDATFYVDRNAPAITSIIFTGKSADQVTGTPVDSYSAGEDFDPQNLESGKIIDPQHPAPGVTATDFGYYFRETTTITVTANDMLGNPKDGKVSGLEYICFYTIDENGNRSQDKKAPVGTENSAPDYASADFVVNAGFRGQVYAYAIDRVRNGASDRYNYKSYKPDDLIVESAADHERTSWINIKIPETQFSDGDGLNLYSENVPVSIEAADMYSGIKKLEYKVESKYDTGSNGSGTAPFDNTYNNNGGTVENWAITEVFHNVATKATTTIDVSNNSNNIEVYVKLTDNAGNITEANIHFSIDKTTPTIEVTYDNNDHSTRNSTDFYNNDRTATIVITERNFDAAKVETVIENTFDTKPGLSSWSHELNDEDPDKNTHTATILYNSDGDYKFDIAFTDLAGNEAADYAEDKFTMDKTAPVTKITFDNNSVQNGMYYKADRTATVTINEHNFSDEDVSITEGYVLSAWSSPSKDVHTATIKFENDGWYEFSVNFSDLARNAAKTESVSNFCIDKTPPEVTISNVKDHSANKGTVAPGITLSDINYNVDDSVTKIQLTRVDIKNESKSIDDFSNKNEMSEDKTVQSVEYDDFAKIESNDGIYKLSATTVDLAGNETTSSITFSVNRFGSTYEYGKETKELVNKGYSNKAVDVLFSEINADKLTSYTITLSYNNGESTTELSEGTDYEVTETNETGKWHKYDYLVHKEVFEREGFYTLMFSSVDESNNKVTNMALKKGKSTEAVPIRFIIDKTLPEITVYGIENGAYYSESSVKVRAVCSDLNIDPASLVVKLNNEVLSPEDYTVDTSQPGQTIVDLDIKAGVDATKYSLEVSVMDHAENTSTLVISDFTLSATMLMLWWANKPLVAATAAGLVVIIAVIAAISKKRKKKKAAAA